MAAVEEVGMPLRPFAKEGVIMRGRYPSGPEFVRKLEGSEQAKQRLQVLLETLAGTCRVSEAYQRLNISEQRFDQIRIDALQAAVHGLEPRPTGRPAHTPNEAELEVQHLKEQIVELEAQLKSALIRAELAVVLPQASGADGKKVLRSPGQSRRPASRKQS
jgi:hypothetical protein